MKTGIFFLSFVLCIRSQILGPDSPPDADYGGAYPNEPPMEPPNEPPMGPPMEPPFEPSLEPPTDPGAVPEPASDGCSDKAPYCAAIPQNNCYSSTVKVCCAACKKFETNDPNCKYGDMHPDCPMMTEKNGKPYCEIEDVKTRCCASCKKYQ